MASDRVNGLALATLALCAALGLPRLALANSYTEHVAAQPGGKLTVEVFAGSVEIESQASPEVSAEATANGSGGGSVAFALTGDGKDTKFTATDGRWVGSPFGSPQVAVRLRVPESYSVDVKTAGGNVELAHLKGEVDARTSGGTIEVEQVQGSVDVKTSGGSIRLEKIKGDVEGMTSGGSIRASEIDGKLALETSGGSIRVDGALGPVNASTSGGSVSVTFAKPPAGDLRTSGGSIEAEFPRASGVHLDARTTGGRVLVESAIQMTRGAERNRIEGEINGGGNDLLLRTTGGNIRVRER